MLKKPKAVVLDSWAVIAYLEDEEAATKVADIISDAHDDHIPLLMTVVNAGEVWYIVARQSSVADADASIKQLRGLGIELLMLIGVLRRTPAILNPEIKCRLPIVLQQRSRSKGRHISRPAITNSNK